MMLINELVSIFYLLFSIYYTSVKATTSHGYKLTVEHSIGDEKFQQKAEIYLSNLKGDDATVVNQVGLSMDDRDKLKSAAKKNLPYRVRVSSHMQDISNAHQQPSDWVMTFIRAKDVLSTNFEIEMELLADGLGNVMSVSINKSFQLHDDEGSLFATDVSVTLPSQALAPDTLGYVNKMEEERRKKEMPSKEPQSFFGKYWMYILPVVFFMMMSNAAQQQPQE